MNKVQTLLALLVNPLPEKIQKRIEKLKGLETSLEEAKARNTENPSDESQEEVDEIDNLLIELQDSICAQLEEIIEKQTPAPEPIKEVNTKTPPKPQEPAPVKKEKKSNWGAAIFIGAVAVFTLGTVILKNRK